MLRVAIAFSSIRADIIDSFIPVKVVESSWNDSEIEQVQKKVLFEMSEQSWKTHFFSILQNKSNTFSAWPIDFCELCSFTY